MFCAGTPHAPLKERRLGYPCEVQPSLFLRVIDSAPQWAAWAEILAVPLQDARRSLESLPREMKSPARCSLSHH
jgi:hypothetical protein